MILSFDFEVTSVDIKVKSIPSFESKVGLGMPRLSASDIHITDVVVTFSGEHVYKAKNSYFSP